MNYSIDDDLINNPEFIEKLDLDITGENIENRKIPLKNYERVLMTIKSDKEICDIIRKIEDDEIIFPKWQRNYVWKLSKASKFIESILLNIPIPMIYCAEEKDMTWAVVDGLQRLTTIQKFKRDELKLNSLEVLIDLNNKKFSDLDDKYKRIFEKRIITFTILSHATSPEIKFDFFTRINTGGTPLNEQELRNCIYRGKLNDYIKELANNEKFQKAFGFCIGKDRFIDVETIFRYLSFREYYNIKEKTILDYSGSISDLINNFMKKHIDDDIKTFDKYKFAFEDNFNKAIELYGDYAFRKLNSDGEFSTKMRANRPLFETILICLEAYSINEILCHKNDIITKTKDLLKNYEFVDAISNATNNLNKIICRFDMYNQMLGSIIK